MKTLLLLAAVLGIAACGDDKSAPSRFDAAPGSPDGQVAPGATFDSFVLDLVNNHTNDNEAAVAIDFTTSDSQSADEFGSLFN